MTLQPYFDYFYSRIKKRSSEFLFHTRCIFADLDFSSIQTQIVDTNGGGIERFRPQMRHRLHPPRRGPIYFLPCIENANTRLFRGCLTRSFRSAGKQNGYQQIIGAIRIIIDIFPTHLRNTQLENSRANNTNFGGAKQTGKRKERRRVRHSLRASR